jgi:hypothetical protein
MGAGVGAHEPEEDGFGGAGADVVVAGLGVELVGGVGEADAVPQPDEVTGEGDLGGAVAVAFEVGDDHGGALGGAVVEDGAHAGGEEWCEVGEGALEYGGVGLVVPLDEGQLGEADVVDESEVEGPRPHRPHAVSGYQATPKSKAP